MDKERSQDVGSFLGLLGIIQSSDWKVIWLIYMIKCDETSHSMIDDLRHIFLEDNAEVDEFLLFKEMARQQKERSERERQRAEQVEF